MVGESSEFPSGQNTSEVQPPAPIPEKAAPSELETRVTSLFEQMPNLYGRQVLISMSEINDMLIRSGIPQEERQRRLQSIAEAVITYKSGYERIEGEVEGPWFLGEEKFFRQALVEHGFVAKEFARVPLRQAIPRAIAETTGLVIGDTIVEVNRNPITRKLWELQAKIWRKSVGCADCVH